MKTTNFINSFKLILVLIITLNSFDLLLSQSLETDSLENVLKSATVDERIKILKGLAKKNFSTSPMKTIEYSKRVLELAQKTDNIIEEAVAFRYIGSGYYTIGSSHEAIKYFQQSVNLYEKLENKQKTSTLLSYIGMAYKDLGEYDKASKYLFESLIVAEEMLLEDASEEKRTNLKITIIDIYNSLGNVYSKLYKNDKALEYYNKTYELGLEIDDKQGIATALHNMGNINLDFGNLDTAEVLLKRSLEIKTQYGAKNSIPSTLHNLADVYWNKKDYAEAYNLYEQAIKMNRETGNNYSLAYGLNNIGGLCIELKEFEKGIKFLSEAQKIAAKMDSKDRLKENYLITSDLYFAMNEFEKSLHYHKLLSEIKDTIYNENSSKQIAEMQTKYETEKKEKEIQIQSLKLENRESLIIFIAVFILFITLVVVLLFNRYKLKQRNFQNELEKSNLEIEQKLLRSQMNPHFIFNSLNSIKSFIIENEPDSAEIYLGKFAKLMRYILDNSRESFIPVEDEINTLQLYMELERVRFSNKFDFKINIEPEIDVERTYIPPMLIQPFVENSILHGVTKKTNKGEIDLDLIKEGNII
ncbi:MAG: tetratricopeptide repeat protein, partial [Bacteroidales bacterium]|nr:tetratricopeptide repeat protein [Bacteroidales bacterium]